MGPRERWDAETVDDALHVLQDIVLWELIPERWEHIGSLLSRLSATLDTGEVDQAREALIELELSGPVRANRIGQTETKGIPEPLLERRNTLVHRLTAEQDRQSGKQQDGSRTEAGRGDRPDR
ncbi:CATRA system-associated protein [Micromonospora sp. NPDC047134]|uniref:CATRA system-associated protein n=1 Tax=Micromonospora sp. NPDC047134 TaxID=3154340 RepID=UPI0033D5E6E2